MLMVAGEFRIYLNLKRHRNIRLQQSINTTVILNRRDHHRKLQHVFFFKGLEAEAARAIIEDCSTRAARILSIPARQYNRGHMLRSKQCRNLLCQLAPLGKIRHVVPVRILAGQGMLGNFGQRSFVLTLEQRLVDRLHFTHVAVKHNLSTQLALVFFDILRLLYVDPNRRRVHRPISRRRPRSRLSDEHCRIRRAHTQPGVELLPAHAKLAPVFQMSVGAAHRGELIARPGVGFRQVRRAG